MEEKKTILAVDDEMWNLKVLESYLVAQGYRFITAMNAQEALDVLEREPNVDIVLSDVMMPGMNGFQLCHEIKKMKKFQSLPVILITALTETINKVSGLTAGASDFLSKPVDPVELKARISAHIRIKTLVDEVESWSHVLEERVEQRTQVIKEKTRQLDDAYFMTMDALITALDVRERETGKHSLRVSFYALELARK